MTMEISEDVVLQISTPQNITGGVGARGAGGAGGAGAVELGRRLLAAARAGHTAAVLELMAAGAPFAADWLGTSPLHAACAGAHAHTAAVLLRAGVSRDSRTKVERTPLHLAAHAGHAALAALLLAHGALVDPRDLLRMTPLHWAAQRGHAAAAAELLRAGADPAARSKFHKTPRQLALAAGHAPLVALLDEALQEREARRATERSGEIPAAEQQRALESIEGPSEAAKPTKPIKVEVEEQRAPKVRLAPGRPGACDPQGTPGTAGGAGAAGGAAQLLRKHGITLLPHDSSSTVLNAIQSGRTVVLSDAGKLMLKESISPPAAPAASTPSPSPASKGVILTAAPVKSPPAAGVKIFTLNNTLLSKAPNRKIINPQDMQIKLVSVPAGRVSKGKARRPPAPAVKIVMHKHRLPRAAAAPAAEARRQLAAPGGAGLPAERAVSQEAGALRVPPQYLSSSSPHYLRSELLAAHRTIHALRHELDQLRRAAT